MPIGLNFRRIAQPTLYQSYQDYLNQALPDISGIFRSTPAQAVEETTEETVAQPAGLTPEQLRLLYPQQNQGGGDDGFRGGGKFGNLDLTRSKTFTKDVYDEEAGEFVPTELTAYYNPTLGNYQTFEGKNINPMFSNTGLPTFGLGSIAARMFGFEPQTVGGYVPGSIRGFYDTPIDFINRNRNEQQRTIQQIAAARKADAERAAALRAMRGSIGRDQGETSSDAGFSGGGRDQGETSSDAGFGGPGETSSGSFGSSTNDSDFSDYS